jgi:PAS domain S-box-containing protein
MQTQENYNKKFMHLEAELEELRLQLEEANETISAIRSGQIDAIVVNGKNGHQVFTLKSADHTYRVFIEKMTEGAVTLNPSGIILYCNSQFAAMVQIPFSKIIGLPFQDFVSPEDQQEYQQLFNKCWSDDCKGEIYINSGKDKTPVQLSLTTLELEEGVALSIILTDLTLQKESQKQLQKKNLELEAANEALESSNHDLQQFASVASHDLQEPLRKIMIFSNLLKLKQNDLKEDSQKYLDKIIDSSGRMKTLIIDILNYSGLSANNNRQEKTDLKKLVAGLLEDFELIIEEKKAEIHISDLPEVAVNKGQIRQVFQNIISNALKFSKQDLAPVINIRAKRVKEKKFDSEEDENGPYYSISIRDNGIGFDQKYKNNIFALFERLNAKDVYEGTGIGLAIAKKIMEKHNGLIGARSVEGEGAEFILILPNTELNQ